MKRSSYGGFFTILLQLVRGVCMVFRKYFIILFNFEKIQICPCEMVLYIDASDETMKNRLLKRGESSGRVDDNEDSIKQRLDTFHQVTKPVVDYYDKQKKLKKVNSEPEPVEVFKEVQKIFDKLEGFDFEESKKIDVSPLKETKVLFLVGGPGSGKVKIN